MAHGPDERFAEHRAGKEMIRYRLDIHQAVPAQPEADAQLAQLVPEASGTAGIAFDGRPYDPCRVVDKTGRIAFPLDDLEVAVCPGHVGPPYPQHRVHQSGAEKKAVSVGIGRFEFEIVTGQLFPPSLRIRRCTAALQQLQNLERPEEDENIGERPVVGRLAQFGEYPVHAHGSGLEKLLSPRAGIQPGEDMGGYGGTVSLGVYGLDGVLQSSRA